MTKDVLRFLSSYSRSSHPFSFPSLLLRSRRRFPSSSRSGEAHMSTHAICQAALSLLNVHTHAFSPSLSLLIPSHRRRAAPIYPGPTGEKRVASWLSRAKEREERRRGGGGSIKNDCLFMSPSYYSPIKYKSLSRSPLSPPLLPLLRPVQSFANIHRWRRELEGR